MDSALVGQLVTVDSGGPVLDGIVFDAPSRSKVVVAVVDPARGPAFRTVHPKLLAERDGEGPSDPVLRQLIRRTPAPVRGAATDGAGAGKGRSGHARAAMHRTTGK